MYSSICQYYKTKVNYMYMRYDPSQQFLPEQYELTIGKGTAILKIEGRKLPPPSKRITFHQKGLKIKQAKIMGKTKKGNVEFVVTRINHLKSFEEVRIHTTEILYPGKYEVIFEFNCSRHESRLKFLEQPNAWQNMNWREVLPCIDESEARKAAQIKIINI